MSDPDPRTLDDDELAEVPDPPRPDGPTPPDAVADDAGTGSRADDPDGAQRPGGAGEDYAGSGF